MEARLRLRYSRELPVTRKLERATRVAVPKRKVRTARPPAGSLAFARWTPHLVRGLYNLWCGACLTALIVLIGLRWLRYSSWSTTPMLNDFLREAMVIEAQTFLWAWVFGTVKGPTVLRALVIVAVCLHRRFREQLVTRVDGVWRLRRQEKTLRNWLLMWIPGGRRCDYNLAELFATAADLRRRYDTPVVMVLGWWLARTQFLGRLRDATFTDENYDVFVVW